MSNQVGGGIARIWKDKGSRRLLVFAGVVITGAAGYAFFGGSTPAGEKSTVRAAADAGGNVTGDHVTPAYQRVSEQATSEKVAVARATGGTVTAPIRPVVNDNMALPTSLDGREEAPDRPRPPVALAAPPVARVQPAQTPAQPALDQAMISSLAQAMAQQMAKLNPAPPVAAQIIYFQRPQAGAEGTAGQPGVLPAAFGQGSAQTAGQSAAGAATAAPAARSRYQAPAAGTIVYSRMVGRVNSDTPGPVVAEVLQGAFSGARLLGSFQFSEEGVIISFSSMTVPYRDADGQERTEVMPIKAVAVDTSHLGTAMATDIDRHLFEKVGTAFAMAFMQGLGQAVSQSGSTAVVNPYGGATITNPTLSMQNQMMMAGGTAAGAAGQAIQQIWGNRRTTITVEAETPFGLLFLRTGN